MDVSSLNIDKDHTAGFLLQQLWNLELDTHRYLPCIYPPRELPAPYNLSRTFFYWAKPNSLA